MTRKRTGDVAPVMTAHALCFLNELGLVDADRQWVVRTAAQIARRRGNERITRVDMVTANYERQERASGRENGGN